MSPRPKHTSRSRRRSRREDAREVLNETITADAKPFLAPAVEEAVAGLAKRVALAVREAANESPERAALDSVREALAPKASCAECDHASDAHESDDGACTMDDCACEGYVAAAASAENEETFTLVTEDGVAVARIVPTSFEDGVVRLGLAPLDGEESVDGTLERLRLHLQNFAIAEVVEEIPAPNGAQPVVTPPPDGGITGELRWVANMVPEATLTDDGRAMAPGSIAWRELPLTLMAMVATSEGGHVGAEVAGRIDDIFRDGNMIKGSGVFAPTEYGSLIASLAVGDDVDPELLARVQSVLLVDSDGALVASLVADQTLRGISVDLAIHQYEVGPKSDYFDADGNWLTEKPAQAEDTEPPSLVDLLFGDESDEPTIFVVTEAVIGAVTVCPFQAFADANIALAADGSPAVWTVKQQSGLVVTRHAAAPAAEEAPATGDALTASAVEAGLAPVAPPASWFDNPELSELTPLTIDEDGRIYGHAAAWDTCHISIPGVCTTAPHSETNYAYFLLKEVLCEDGERVPCGTVTLETGHANKSLGRGDATAHYDNTGLASADVNVGEDEFGIWVAGAIRPDLSAAKARGLRGAVLSGDWRSVNGNLELVALLAVNVPGFPVPRARALVASGEDGSEVLALVAAGITIGDVGELDVDGAKVFTPLQMEKIRAYEAIASGRLSALRARAAGGLVSKDQLRLAAGFDADLDEPEAPAEEPEAVE